MEAFEIFTWCVVPVSICTAILNANRIKACFYFGIATNGTWCVIDSIYGIYAQALLFFLFTCLAVYGLIIWKKADETKDETTDKLFKAYFKIDELEFENKKLRNKV